MDPKIEAVKIETAKKMHLSMEIEDFFILSTLIACMF